MFVAPLLASVFLASTPSAAPLPETPPVRLAQGRAVEVVIDERGRRLIVDAWSGEVIAVLPPKRRNRPEFDGGYDRPRLLRERLREERLLDEEFSDEDYPPEDVAPRVKPKPKIVRKAPAKPKPRIDAEPEVITATTPKSRKPAAPVDQPYPGAKASEAIATVQVVLDRAGLSPGVIDGRPGDNLNKALDAYEQKTGTRLDLTDSAAIELALADSGDAPFTTYTITAEDAAGPYVASVPADYSEKAQMDRLSYTSTLEMLAERFHMSEAYLKALNPEASFNRPGTRIRVAATGAPLGAGVTKIIADKGAKQVRAYDGSGRLVAAYPATIGSTDTPSPSGVVAVDRIAFNPTYTYNPKINFKQGENDRILTIPPGPNGPVGSVWIALSKPTYGIHGTPEPAQIGKTNSHGCVRLTNWDAEELARMVKPGVSVHFVE